MLIAAISYDCEQSIMQKNQFVNSTRTRINTGFLAKVLKIFRNLNFERRESRFFKNFLPKKFFKKFFLRVF